MRLGLLVGDLAAIRGLPWESLGLGLMREPVGRETKGCLWGVFRAMV